MRLCLTVLLSIAACVAPATAASSHPEEGTWRLIPAKSKYQYGPPPKSMTIQYLPATAGIHYNSRGVNADGQKFSSSFVAQTDGREYPVTGSRKWAPVMLKRVDSRTLQATYVRYGRTMAIAKSVLSEDGSTMTVTTRASNGRGSVYTNVSFYQKQ